MEKDWILDLLNNSKGIKCVIKNTVETNSSSSNSICINPWNSDGISKRDLEEISKLIDSEGTFHIPVRKQFSIGYYNDSYTKIQFIEYLIRYLNEFKHLKTFYSIIKDITGCKTVVSEFVLNYRKEKRKDPNTEMIYLNELSNYEDLEYSGYSVFQSKESLKNFLFNRNSWLFFNSDGKKLSSLDYKFISENRSLGEEIEASIYLPDPIGRLDINIKVDTIRRSFSLSNIIKYRFFKLFLDYIRIDPKSNKSIVYNEDAQSKDDELLRYYNNISRKLNDTLYIYSNNKEYVWFFKRKVMKHLETILNKNNTPKEKNIEQDDLIKVENYFSTLKENIDFYKTPISIKCKTFGTLEL